MRRNRGNSWRNRLDIPERADRSRDSQYTYNPNWTGDFRDAFVVPQIREPDYSQYRYVSNFEVLANGAALDRYFPSHMRVSEIEGVLSRTAIFNPFELNEKDFDAPKLQRPKFPDPPSDPRPLLSTQQPKPF